MHTHTTDRRLDDAIAHATTEGRAVRVVITPDRLHVEPMTTADPVRALLGWRAGPDAIAVAVDAPATARTTDDTDAPLDGRVRHVHHIDATCTTTFCADGEVRTTATRTTGRVPDACRRALGLPTDPPPATMSEFVTDTWLHLITRVAAADPGMGWARAVELHPAIALGGARASNASPPTPGALAQRARALGLGLDWERFRVVTIAAGGSPVIDLSAAEIEWMDAGMFARWALDELPDRRLVLDLLAALVDPATLDLLWATVALIDDH